MPALSRHSLALGCIGAAIAAGTACGGMQQSLLYPPQVRVRTVVVVNDDYLQRRYWDPRYCRHVRTSAGAAAAMPPRGRDR